jgi:hypothetical protein
VTTPNEVLQKTQDQTAPPAYLYHIPLHGKPLDEDELSRLRRFVYQLVSILSSTRSLAGQYFIQIPRLGKEPWNDLLSMNSKFWRVAVGLGIRPAKPLPAPPNLKDVLSRKLPIPLELVYKIDTNPYIHIFIPNPKIPSPASIYLGCGGCQLFLVTNPDEFLPRAKSVFAKGLHSSLEVHDFCVPLFGLKDFVSASAETIRIWFDLFDVFVGEVQDEPGILIASREPITQPLADLQHFLNG